MEKKESDSQEDKSIILDKKQTGIIPKEASKKKLKRRIKNSLFLLMWLYLLTNIFISDFDILIVNSLGVLDLKFYVILRFLIVILILFVVWVIIGNKRFWKNIGLFVIFPIYPSLWFFLKNVFWNIPEFLLYRRWHVLLYYYIESVIKFLYEFKWIQIRTLLFIIGFLIIFIFSSYWLLIPIAIFTYLQFHHIYIRFKQTFSPIRIFKIKVDEYESVSSKELSPEKIDELISDNVGENNISDEEEKVKKMERFLLIIELANIFDIKLKEILNNRTYMLSFLGKALFSFFISMVYLGAINFALFKFDPSLFIVGDNAKYFDFFYYSFFTVFPEGTDIEPVGMITKSVRMVGVTIGVVINLLLLTFYIAISNERYKENLGKLSIFAENYSKEISIYFVKKFGYNPSDGLEKLKTFGSNIDNIIQLFRGEKVSKRQ